MKHLLGFVVAALTFSVAFLSTPIGFVNEGVGSGTLEGSDSFCSFSVHRSTYFESVTFWSCVFDEDSRASEYFDSIAFKNVPISRGKSHYVIKYDEIHCSTELRGRNMLIVCSPSLRHVIEFERQFIRR